MSHRTHYIYPLVVEKSTNALGMYFPDFDGTAIVTDNLVDGIKQAKEILSYRLFELEISNTPIPNPSSIEHIELLDATDKIVFIEVYMPPYRNEAYNKAVTKNCTLPRWLRDMAEDAGLNFSQLLQSAIKDALGLKDYHK